MTFLTDIIKNKKIHLIEVRFVYCQGHGISS